MNILLYANAFIPKIDGICYRLVQFLDFVDINYPDINIILVTPYPFCNNKYKRFKIYNSYGKRLDFACKDNSKIYYIPTKNLRKFKDYLDDIIFLNNIDIIHIFQGDITTGLILELSKKFNIPVVYSWHTHIHEYLKKYNYNLILIKLLQIFYKFTMFNYCDYFWSVSKSAEENLIKNNLLSTTKRDILPPFVCTETFHPIEKKINDKFTLLYVGRITREKNIDFIINFINNNKNFNLILVGDGCYKDNLVQLTTSLNLNNNIEFVGQVDRNNLYKYYNKADCFIQASKTETMGFVTLEAMACKTPVIGFNDCGTKDIIKHNETGYLFNNENELLNSLNLIKDNKDRIVFNAYNYVKLLTIDNYCKTNLDLYNFLIKNKKNQKLFDKLIFNIRLFLYNIFIYILWIFNY